MKYPDIWHEPDRQGDGINYLASFSIPLRNVGLGAAKNVKISWDFEMEKVVSEVNELAQKSLKPAYFNYDGKRLELNSESFGAFVSNWETQKKVNIDFVLPSSQENAPVEVILPHAYIQLVSALIYFSSNIKDRKGFPDFPSLKMVAEYQDIGAKSFKSSFSLTTNIVHVVGNGVWRLY